MQRIAAAASVCEEGGNGQKKRKSPRTSLF
jgi:hypothetical protein